MVPIFDAGETATTHAQHTPSAHTGPNYPVVWLHNRVGVPEAGDRIGSESQWSFRPKAASEQGGSTGTGGLLEAAQPWSTAGPLPPFSNVSREPLAPALLLSRARVLVLGKGGGHTKG